MINMLTIKTELKPKVEYTEEEFREEAKGMIQFAINEKGYSFNELSPDMIAEDITGIWGEHQMPKDGMDIIRKELITAGQIMNSK